MDIMAGTCDSTLGQYAIGSWLYRVEGRGFESSCGLFFFLPHFIPPHFPLFFPLLSFFLSPFPFSPSYSLRHFNAQAFFKLISSLHNNTLAHGTVTNDNVGLHEYSC